MPKTLVISTREAIAEASRERRCQWTEEFNRYENIASWQYDEDRDPVEA